MDQIHQFINDPTVSPLYAILVVSVIDFLLAIYRSIQGRVFDWQKLPQILDSIVLQKVIPLAALGSAAFFVTDTQAHQGLLLAYSGLAGVVLASQVAALIDKVRGAYEATASK